MRKTTSRISNVVSTVTFGTYIHEQDRERVLRPHRALHIPTEDQRRIHTPINEKNTTSNWNRGK